MLGKLLETQAQASAYAMLSHVRPKDKFSGDTKRMDLEDFLCDFEASTAVPGATASMKLMELKHWFSGKAALVVKGFGRAEDAEQGLKEAKEALKQNFGLRRFTARQLLDDLIVGEKFAEREHDGIQTFIIKLEMVYRQAVETGRASTFSSQETYEEILRVKLPHLVVKWARIRADVEETGYCAEDKWDFPKFVNFLRKHNRSSEIASQVNKTKPNSAQKTGVNSRVVTGMCPQATSEIVAQEDSSEPLGQRAQPLKRVQFSVEHPCPVCDGKHGVEECRQLLESNPAQRWSMCRVKWLCFLCLMPGHTVERCASARRCLQCQGRHHPMLHRGEARMDQAS